MFLVFLFTASICTYSVIVWCCAARRLSRLLSLVTLCLVSPDDNTWGRKEALVCRFALSTFSKSLMEKKILAEIRFLDYLRILRFSYVPLN